MPRPYYVSSELTSGLEPIARHAARLAGLIEKHLTPRRKIRERQDFLVDVFEAPGQRPRAAELTDRVRGQDDEDQIREHRLAQ